MSSKFEVLAVAGEPVRLYASGTRDTDARAAPAAGAPRVVVFHPWWGLNDDVIAYVDRLAGAGFSVVAPDLVRGHVASTVEEAERLASGKDDEHANAVALAAIDRLAASDGASRIGAVGFSMGAAWAMWSAAKRPAVAASAVYYGSLQGPSLTRATVPVLGHFAEADPYEPDEAVLAFERTLRDAGRSVVIHRYPGTGHWFAEPSRDAWRREASELAFERTVTFLREHLEPRRHAG
jgi:carboxymethylenebutenolidase